MMEKEEMNKKDLLLIIAILVLAGIVVFLGDAALTKYFPVTD